MSNRSILIDRIGRPVALLIVAGLAVACARKPYVPVHYQMPPAGQSAHERPVHVTLADRPISGRVFSARAQAEAKIETDALSLVVAAGETAPESLGTMPPDALLLEGMTLRMRQMGLTVRSVAGQGDSTMVLTLDRFKVDFARKYWTVDIGYTLLLKGKGSRTVSQSISASGERRKLFGTKELEILIGDVFTDAVNRIDLNDLIGKAGL
jgi:hypothetical protein